MHPPLPAGIATPVVLGEAKSRVSALYEGQSKSPIVPESTVPPFASIDAAAKPATCALQTSLHPDCPGRREANYSRESASTIAIS